ncbi:MAG: phospholipase D-like domain-containing protein [Candidatus Freyarchaeum deiterrae]
MTVYKRTSLERLADLATKIKITLSPEKTTMFLKMLEERGFTHPTSFDIDRLGLPPNKADLLKRYIGSIEKKEELIAISLSLLDDTKSESSSPMEVCWTGPSENRHIRMTWPALSEMLLSAEKSILIIGYAINANMRSLMDYLEEKSKSGVRLVFMMDRLKEKEDFLCWAKGLPQPPELYDRPEDPEDPMSALHVKCVVVDEKVAMFGSANLTYHGMKGNIELGLVLHDEKIVKNIVDLLEGLKKELVRFNLSEYRANSNVGNS